MSELKHVIKLCAYLRGVDGLEHRVVYEFGWFLQQMVNFLVFDNLSNDKHLREFQTLLKNVEKTLGARKFYELFNAQDIDTYIKLFEIYCIWLYGFRLSKE